MGIDLSKIQDTDLFAATAPDGVTYKVTGAQFKTLFEDPVPGFITSTVGIETTEWDKYIFFKNYDTNADLDITDDTIWYYGMSQRDPKIIFRDDSNKALFASKARSRLKVEVIFKPPGGINVQSTLTITAGFHERAQLGTLAVNGSDVLSFEAWDLRPEDFTVAFTGDLNEFSIRQNELAPGDDNTAPAIAAIYLDGKRLLTQTATTLTFANDDEGFFSTLKVGTRLKQVSPEVEGVVSKLYPGELKVVLDDEYPEFVSGSTVIIVD